MGIGARIASAGLVYSLIVGRHIFFSRGLNTHDAVVLTWYRLTWPRAPGYEDDASIV